jgi:hypothetical protein
MTFDGAALLTQVVPEPDSVSGSVSYYAQRLSGLMWVVRMSSTLPAMASGCA